MTTKLVRRTSEEVARDKALATLAAWGVVIDRDCPAPDVPAPTWSSPPGTVTHGWLPGTYGAHPTQVTSVAGAHYRGEHITEFAGRVGSQGGIALYSTPEKAIEAWRWTSLVTLATQHNEATAHLRSQKKARP